MLNEKILLSNVVHIVLLLSALCAACEHDINFKFY